MQSDFNLLPGAASAWMFKQGTGTGLLPIKSQWKFTVHCLSPWPASPTGIHHSRCSVRIKAPPCWVRARAWSVPRCSRGQAGYRGSTRSPWAWDVLPRWALRAFSPALPSPLLESSLPSRIISAGRRLSPGMAGAAGLSGPQLGCGSVTESMGPDLFWPPQAPFSTGQALVQRMDTFRRVALLPQGSQGLQVADVPPAPRTARFIRQDFVSFQVISFTLFSIPC